MKRCTPRKIKKINKVSALKLLFEQDEETSPLTRGHVELLQHPSTQQIKISLGATTTTTSDAEFCVSQSGGLLRTGPRQCDTRVASQSQDWPRQARAREGGPMGDALTWAGGEEQCTECTHTVQTVQR